MLLDPLPPVINCHTFSDSLFPLERDVLNGRPLFRPLSRRDVIKPAEATLHIDRQSTIDGSAQTQWQSHYRDPAVVLPLSRRHMIKPAEATLLIVFVNLLSNSHAVNPAVVRPLSRRDAIKPAAGTLRL